MEITRIVAKDSYLFATGTGEFDPAQALELFKVIVDACSKHKRSKLLIDFTQVEGEISILVLYEMGTKMAGNAAGVSHLALVDRPERILPDRFWQTVTRNNGLNALVASSFAEAETWLMNCGNGEAI
jgi:hypothetical protein